MVIPAGTYKMKLLCFQFFLVLCMLSHDLHRKGTKHKIRKKSCKSRRVHAWRTYTGVQMYNTGFKWYTYRRTYTTHARWFVFMLRLTVYFYRKGTRYIITESGSQSARLKSTYVGYVYGVHMPSKATRDISHEYYLIRESLHIFKRGTYGTFPGTAVPCISAKTSKKNAALSTQPMQGRCNTCVTRSMYVHPVRTW